MNRLPKMSEAELSNMGLVCFSLTCSKKNNNNAEVHGNSVEIARLYNSPARPVTLPGLESQLPKMDGELPVPASNHKF